MKEQSISKQADHLRNILLNEGEMSINELFKLSKMDVSYFSMSLAVLTCDGKVVLLERPDNLTVSLICFL